MPPSAMKFFANMWRSCTGAMASFVSARNAILSIQSVRRELRGKLGRCWDCIRAWQFETPLKSRVPMPEDLVRALFAIAEGLAATKDREVLTRFAFALLIRVGFECLLRPGELLKSKVKDLRPAALPVRTSGLCAYTPRCQK